MNILKTIKATTLTLLFTALVGCGAQTKPELPPVKARITNAAIVSVDTINDGYVANIKVNGKDQSLYIPSEYAFKFEFVNTLITDEQIKLINDTMVGIHDLEVQVNTKTYNNLTPTFVATSDVEIGVHVVGQVESYSNEGEAYINDNFYSIDKKVEKGTSVVLLRSKVIDNTTLYVIENFEHRYPVEVSTARVYGSRSCDNYNTYGHTSYGTISVGSIVFNECKTIRQTDLIKVYGSYDKNSMRFNATHYFNYGDNNPFEQN